MTYSRSPIFGVVTVSLITLSAAALAATGDPLPDVDVSLERKPGGLVKQVKTDPQGNFSFGVVKDGEYVITAKPNASPPPRHVGTSGNAAASESTAKRFFESRSNTVRTGGTNALRFQVVVNVANTRSAMGTMQGDGVQHMQVNTSGGHIRGRITAE
jgi:hypothetical protein